MSGYNGEAYRVSGSKTKVASFTLTTLVSQILLLGDNRLQQSDTRSAPGATVIPMSIYVTLAGPATLTFKWTRDSFEAISKGTAVWSPVTSFTALAASAYLASLAEATAIMVSHVKSGTGTDDAPTLALLGGARCQVRVVQDPMAVSGDALKPFVKVTADA